MRRPGRPPVADIDAADRRHAAAVSLAHRQKYELTQRALARTLGIAPSQISLVERGHHSARTRSVAALLRLDERT